MIQRRKKEGAALPVMYAERKAEHIRVERQHKISMGCDLTLVYARLKMWEQVDDFCGTILQLLGTIGNTLQDFDKIPVVPDFKSGEDELQWCQYMVRRAVACVHLGKDHF